MVLHVADIACAALGAEAVYIATDDSRIADVVRGAGYQVIMTGRAATGTDRLWQAARQVQADFYINIQGDEPLLDPEDIRRIADVKRTLCEGVVNGMCALAPDEAPDNPNIPKVVCNEAGRLVYMSRSPIPGGKNGLSAPEHYLKQVCIYGFTFNELQRFGEFSRKGALEEREDIEILRFLEFDIPVQMVTTSGASLAVDVPGDIARVETAMLARGVAPRRAGGAA